MEGQWMGQGRIWKERARALRFQIRDRFRVAVDRHRHWPTFTETFVDQYPPLLQRWTHRVRYFLGGHRSHPSPFITNDATPGSPGSFSSRFYRKRVGKEMDEFDDSTVIKWLQALAVPVIGSACHVFMHGLNHVQIYGAEKLHQALLERPKGKSLVTVSNHVAAIDDPFVIASLLPPSVMLNSHNIRWTLCATDRCFSNPMFSAFFRCVKVLPVSRGDGIYQKGMDLALLKLNNGGWVHIFPEGSRSRNGGRIIGSAKRGVGRLVMDADNIPVVVPFVHTGMQEIMPVGNHFPKIGKRVTVIVGDPINFEDLLLSNDDSNHHFSRDVLYDGVSSRITERLHELKVQVDRLVMEQSTKLQNSYLSNAERASGIWQKLDWEAFGLEEGRSGDDLSAPRPNISSETNLIPSQSYQQQQLPTIPPQESLKMGFSYEGGVVSRLRGYMNPSEFMGFAARGLFMNIRTSGEHPSTKFQEVRRLKVWKRFIETNVLTKLNGV